jgi:hypothetical protein
MTSLLNFFDKDGDSIVDNNNWGPMLVNFGPGGTGPTDPTGPTGPTGPAGHGSDLLIFSNVGDAAIQSNATNFLGRCKNTGSVGEAITMLRSGYVNSIFAS